MCATAKSADFSSDEFPVGKIAELFLQVRQLDGWLQPAEQPASDESDVAQTFSERAERELANVKKILAEVDYLAHSGQRDDDPAMALAVIERLAGEGQRELYGRFWDELTAALKRADGVE